MSLKQVLSETTEETVRVIGHESSALLVCVSQQEMHRDSSICSLHKSESAADLGMALNLMLTYY